MKRILILLLFLPSVAFGQALITIDHTAIDMFDAGIPTYYINLVKQMTFLCACLATQENLGPTGLVVVTCTNCMSALNYCSLWCDKWISLFMAGIIPP